MTNRFNDQEFRPVGLSNSQLRELAQRRGTDRWYDELKRKYRNWETGAETGSQDIITPEHVATDADWERYDEIMREEYDKVGQEPLFT